MRHDASAAMRHVTDAERRYRLGVRQGLAPGAAWNTIEDATNGMTVLHATEPASVHLALRARVSGITIADVEKALYEDRTIVKQLAMRQTLFGFTRDLLPAGLVSASARLVGPLCNRLAKDLEFSGLTDDGAAWLAKVSDAVVEVLTEREASASDLRDLVPALDAKVQRGAGKWGAAVPVAPQVLSLLCAQGGIVRAHNSGHWRLSKPRYTAMPTWLGDSLGGSADSEREGYAELIRRWLWTFGPGTEADLKWWLGGTLGTVRTTLADLGAVAVTVDGERGRETAWLLAEDAEPVEGPGEWVALLPTLDPTVMGWRGRDFYLAPHRDMTFDSAGNAGTTAWWDGRIVGCWVQAPGGVARVHLLEDVPAGVRAAFDAEASRLTAWLDGVVVTSIYASAAMKAARA